MIYIEQSLCRVISLPPSFLPPFLPRSLPSCCNSPSCPGLPLSLPVSASRLPRAGSKGMPVCDQLSYLVPSVRVTPVVANSEFSTLFSTTRNSKLIWPCGRKRRECLDGKLLFLDVLHQHHFPAEPLRGWRQRLHFNAQRSGMQLSCLCLGFRSSAESRIYILSWRQRQQASMNPWHADHQGDILRWVMALWKEAEISLQSHPESF